MARAPETLRPHSRWVATGRSAHVRQPTGLRAEFRAFTGTALQPDLTNALLLASGFLCLLTVIGLTIALLNGPVLGWEVNLLREIQKVEYPPWLSTLTAGSFTDPFSQRGATIVVMAAAILVLWRRPVEAILVISLVALRVPAHFSKALVERERPSGEFEGITGRGGELSFASGHAEWVITLYGFLAVLAILHVRSAWIRAAIAMTYVAFVLVTTFARLNGGHHWPLDMIGGWILGVGLVCLALWLRRGLLATSLRDQLR
jgi:undecaprenyl-diphosphatase